jgi:hypothetical protein
MNDVQIGGHSIFDTSTDWREVVGQIVREIGECAGSKTLREYWINALKHRGPSDFTSAEFFNTLKNVYLEFLAQRREPLQLDESPPGLIDILVFLDAENVKKKLKFQLNSISLGYVYKHVGEVGLGEGNVDLRAVELSKLARDYLSRILVRDKVNPLVEVPSFHKLRTQGVDLWRKLIPDDLKRAYINLRTEKDLTIFIVSDDPSFPWELIKPVEVKGNISQNAFTDDWLAVRFSFARWLSGFPPPAKELSLKRICCVATDGKLTAASEERDHLKKIAVTFDEPQSFDELLRFLGTQDYDLIHFACHGDFNINQPGESVVLLPDGNYLRPSDFLEDGIMAKFNENHPMVFINSCHSGRTGPSLIGIEGWAKELINLGSGAFIGCGWEVNDPLAAKFAVAFYKYFKGGMCMGKAVHEARLEIMRKAPQNSTWLAYYLYGNPDCRIRH